MRTQVSHFGSPALCQARALPVSVSLPATRVANIDRLRILAAIGIVWFHTDGAPYRGIVYAGLPIFLLVFCSLLTSQGCTGATADFLKRRWNRLLKPWLFWSVIYGLCRLVKVRHDVDISSFRGMISVETILAGPSIHLWYLPYAFAAGIVIRELNRWTRHISSTTVILTSAAVGAALLAAHSLWSWDHLARPLPQWEFGLAAIPLGVAIGRCLTIPSQERQRRFLLAISLIVILECQVLYWFGFGVPLLPYAIGVVSVCFAYCWEIRSDVVVASLAPLTFGVYLIHPLVILGLRQISAMDGHYAVFVSLSVCISALATLILMKTPLRQFV
ncbi:MAG: acyltransferase family protein [Solirubrobacterales bacterium]